MADQNTDPKNKPSEKPSQEASTSTEASITPTSKNSKEASASESTSTQDVSVQQEKVTVSEETKEPQLAMATADGSTSNVRYDYEAEEKKALHNINSYLKSTWDEIKSYFNVSHDIESHKDIQNSILSGISFKGANLLILIFAIFVASLGLNTNSVPVIIGAMLISPLMGPIIGMGLAIGISDFKLLNRCLRNISMAVVGSVLASALYFLISPQYETSSQLLARTSPSIFDVLVALFGGAAGIIGIASKNKGQVIPGVAIATSLMPPLCTAGYGLATWQSHFFFGALYLFFTNMVFIFVATWIGIKAMRFKNVVYTNKKLGQRVRNGIYVTVVCTIALSIYLTVQMVEKNTFLQKAQEFVNDEIVFPNTQVLSHKEFIEGSKRYIDVTLIGDALPLDSIKLVLLNKLDSCGLHGTYLNIKQGFTVNSESEFNMQKNADSFYTVMQNEVNRRQVQIDSLQRVISNLKDFADESPEIAKEVKVLFPDITDIAFTNMILTNIDSGVNDTLNIAFLELKRKISEQERVKLEEYLKIRLNRKNIHLCVDSKLPWPRKKEETVKELPEQKKNNTHKAHSWHAKS